VLRRCAGLPCLYELFRWRIQERLVFFVQDRAQFIQIDISPGNYARDLAAASHLQFSSPLFQSQKIRCGEVRPTCYIGREFRRLNCQKRLVLRGVVPSELF